jgi:RluA family pseudouridine synthase
MLSSVVAKLPYIEFSNGLRIPILHEDRNVLAIDKPEGWMLAPVMWQNTSRNLAAALSSSLNAGDFWASSRGLKFIRFVHRLDADTSGVLLLVKAPGAMPAYTELFEDRKVEKVYLAVVQGVPEVEAWKCRLRLAPVPERAGRMQINNAQGKDAETLFRVVETRADRALVMCWPLTGRTHQIRLHLLAAGHPIIGDELYGQVPTTNEEKVETKLALRAIQIGYRDPFTATPVVIKADTAAFVKLHGFNPDSELLRNTAPPSKVDEHPKARLELKPRSEHPGHARRERPFADRDRPHPRRDWQEDEDSGDFQSSATREPQFGGERPPRRGFDRGPRGERRFGGQRPFGGPPRFEPREGEFRERGPRSYGGPRRFESREREFPGRGPQRPRFGKERFAGEETHAGRTGERGGREPQRFGERPRGPGVFPSSAKGGLKAGFQKPGGFGGRPERRPFRSSMQDRPFSPGSAGRPFRGREEGPPHEGRPPRGKFGGGGGGRGGFGRKPFGGPGGAKPGWGRKPAGRPFKKFSGPR